MIPRYAMSMWYQWFSPAPRITIERPLVFSAFEANSRATWMMCARGTPVTRSAQAGVNGLSSS